MKFTQPVSMQCSQEQFEKDLKEPLEKLGYIASNFGNFEYYPFLYTTYKGNIPIMSNSGMHNIGFINHYNPQLCIALSSMTDEPNGIEGEYFVSKERCLPIKLIQKGDCLGVGYGLERKATKEELINHFTKKEESKEQPKLEYLPSMLNEAIDLVNQLIATEPKNIPYSEHQKMISTYEERLVGLQKLIDDLQENYANTFKKNTDQQSRIKELEEKNTSMSLELISSKDVELLRINEKIITTLKEKTAEIK